MNKEEAIALSETKFWEKMTAEQIVNFQLIEENLLCMPFSVFHQAVEIALGRSVWTHEFAFKQKLIDEFLGKCKQPTMQEIINLIPKDKQIIFFKTK